ncbi:hypothetical protein EC973_004940 [Apophysomyces ossiformis]|uniref:Ubinuclein middle domain-containing protein n=1 Tax=Apophysomyces ossiformis TaxID=679940 RepID=A0A8H7BE94_9FUNG|nr:hypothetical protein EC973_004940 [Apophysomyces ossiformis]
MNKEQTSDTSINKHSSRIQVDVDFDNLPTVFSYQALVRLAQNNRSTSLATYTQKQAEPLDDDDFYKGLLERAALYSTKDKDGNDADADDESDDSQPRKGDEYDYDDPFIDDSDMILDTSYDYTLPEHDGFFVYHGSLDGQANLTSNDLLKAPKTAATKRKATTKAKEKAVANTNGLKKEKPRKPTATTSSQKVVPELIEISDGEERLDTEKKRTSQLSSSTMTTKSVNPSVTESKLSDMSKNTITSSSGVEQRQSKPSMAGKAIEKSSSTSTLAAARANEETNAAVAATGQDKKKKTPSGPSALLPLDPELNELMDKLRKDVAFESFENKAKFPQSLRPTVFAAGSIIFRKYNCAEDNFINHLMTLLPYNRFTLKKFITTKVGPTRINELNQEIQELVDLLKSKVNEMMPEQIRQYNERVNSSEVSSETAPSGDTEKRFRFNEETRKILYEIMNKELIATAIQNEIGMLTGVTENTVAEGKARKIMYQRLLSCWPEGWMTSYDISRHYSQYKLKIRRKNEDAKSSTNTPVTPPVVRRAVKRPVQSEVPTSPVSTAASKATSLPSTGYPKGVKRAVLPAPAEESSAKKGEREKLL